METITYNGKGATLGRIGSLIAKDLLKGHNVNVINAEQVIITGNKKNIIEKIQQKRNMGSGGSLKGPTYIREPEKLLKRMIRGMLPWDRTKGREAYKRLRCYKGQTEEQKETKTITWKKPQQYTTIEEVTKKLR
jgi:large subunit ribosomal protein L13